MYILAPGMCSRSDSITDLIDQRKPCSKGPGEYSPHNGRPKNTAEDGGSQKKTISGSFSQQLANRSSVCLDTDDGQIFAPVII